MSKNNKHEDLGHMCLSMLKDRYVVSKEIIGTDEYKKAKGMVFRTEAFRVGEIGHLCIVRMEGLLGMMEMETVVFTVTGKDVPLINLDWVSVMGKETMMIEMYDDQLDPYPEEYLHTFDELKKRDTDIPDGRASAHWYDSITYPCSYHKKAKGKANRFNQAAADYFSAFLDQVGAMPACDPLTKEKRAGAFASRLLEEGGPAVDQVKKLFGAEFAHRLVLNYMYGVGSAYALDWQ